MKLSCKVIEDMLPLYCDGVCSEESKRLVEEHLSGCPACKRILGELREEIGLPEEPVDDLKPLAGIGTKWKKEKRRAAKMGACVALAVVLSVFLLWSGIWYFGYAIHYDRLAEKLERVGNDAGTTASHGLTYGEHAVVLKKPGFLGDGGFVHIGEKEMVFFLDEDGKQTGQNKDLYIDLFFYPKFGGGYEGAIMFDDGHTLWWVWLTSDLTYNYELSGDNCPAEEIAAKEQLLAENREEIAELVNVAKEIWGIDPLK